MISTSGGHRMSAAVTVPSPRTSRRSRADSPSKSLSAQLLDLQDQLRHVFLEHAGSPKIRDDTSETRSEVTAAPGSDESRHAPQGIAERNTVAAFQRADDKAPIVPRAGIALDLGQHHVIVRSQSLLTRTGAGSATAAHPV